MKLNKKNHFQKYLINKNYKFIEKFLDNKMLRIVGYYF